MLSKLLGSSHKEIAVLSRGYKRKTSNQIIFQDIKDFNAIEVGDEPYYMKQVLQRVPIIIDNNTDLITLGPDLKVGASGESNTCKALLSPISSI